jgi:hypothetical protein
MIKPSFNLQELRRKIYSKAKAEKQWRFWGLYAHLTKTETLTVAYREAKANDGMPDIDGESFQSIIDLRELSSLCGFGEVAKFQQAHRRWVDDALTRERRQGKVCGRKRSQLAI